MNFHCLVRELPTKEQQEQENKEIHRINKGLWQWPYAKTSMSRRYEETVRSIRKRINVSINLFVRNNKYLIASNIDSLRGPICFSISMSLLLIL